MSQTGLQRSSRSQKCFYCFWKTFQTPGFVKIENKNVWWYWLTHQTDFVSPYQYHWSLISMDFHESCCHYKIIRTTPPPKKWRESKIFFGIIFLWEKKNALKMYLRRTSAIRSSASPPFFFRLEETSKCF